MEVNYQRFSADHFSALSSTSLSLWAPLRCEVWQAQPRPEVSWSALSRSHPNPCLWHPPRAILCVFILPSVEFVIISRAFRAFSLPEKVWLRSRLILSITYHITLLLSSPGDFALIKETQWLAKSSNVFFPGNPAGVTSVHTVHTCCRPAQRFPP